MWIIKHIVYHPLFMQYLKKLEKVIRCKNCQSKIVDNDDSSNGQ